MQVTYPKGVRQVRLNVHECRTLKNAAFIFKELSTLLPDDEDREQQRNAAMLAEETAAEYAPAKVHEAAEIEESVPDGAANGKGGKQ